MEVRGFEHLTACMPCGRSDWSGEVGIIRKSRSRDSAPIVLCGIPVRTRGWRLPSERPFRILTTHLVCSRVWRVQQSRIDGSSPSCSAGADEELQVILTSESSVVPNLCDMVTE